MDKDVASDKSGLLISDIGFQNKTWKHHGFNVFIYVMRFIGHITKANFATSFRLMRRNVFNLIED